MEQEEGGGGAAGPADELPDDSLRRETWVGGRVVAQIRPLVVEHPEGHPVAPSVAPSLQLRFRQRDDEPLDDVKVDAQRFGFLVVEKDRPVARSSLLECELHDPSLELLDVSVVQLGLGGLLKG